MSQTIIERLADFSASTDIARLPFDVIGECKRDVLDTLGCALAGVDHPRGRIGIEAGKRLGGTGGTGGSATIIGGGKKSTPHGAAFANGELANALNADSMLLPGHVSPYVLSGAGVTTPLGQGPDCRRGRVARDLLSVQGGVAIRSVH